MSKYWKILDNDDISEDPKMPSLLEVIGDSREKKDMFKEKIINLSILSKVRENIK